MAEKPEKSPSRVWKIVLALSLALNVAVIGLIGGAVARDKVGGRPPSGFEFGAGPLGRALSQDDRRELGRSIRERVDFGSEGRPTPRRTIREIQSILREENLDVAKLQSVLDRSVTRAKTFQSAAQAALIEHISQMTVEERQAYADRLSHRQR